MARYEEVQTIRRKQTELPKEVKELRKVRPSRQRRKILEEKVKWEAWIGRTWLHVYERAAMTLSNTRAAGGRDAVKKSYQNVKRNIGNPKQAKRYYVFDPRFLRRVEIDVDVTARRDKKIVPLYDLTHW